MTRLFQWCTLAVGCLIAVLLVLILRKMPGLEERPPTVAEWEAAKEKGRAAMDAVKARAAYVVVDNTVAVEGMVEIHPHTTSIGVNVENFPDVQHVKILDTNGPLSVTIDK